MSIRVSAAAGVVMEKELLLHEAVISNEAETVRRILEDREGLNVDCRNNVKFFSRYRF